MSSSITSLHLRTRLRAGLSAGVRAAVRGNTQTPQYPSPPDTHKHTATVPAVSDMVHQPLG